MEKDVADEKRELIDNFSGSGSRSRSKLPRARRDESGWRTN